ncbi:hypothetical protein ACLF3G_29015 [Falsiroseomonas sp. HC035]|uniref:hypothetical protein n=1 Tax=Falsiroseomonas sp. HC035 TaxID=3390999 RepID=UPI003D317F51
MAKAKLSHRERDSSTVHPHAAAIDIGVTMRVAAVRPERDAEPVQSFGTFTARCCVRTAAMESAGVYWTYNPRRRHAAIGFLSLMAFERWASSG